MTSDLVRQRQNCSKICDRPAIWRKASEVDHATHYGDDEGIHPLEVADDTVETYPESGSFELLGCGRPFRVDAESVADECF